MRLPALVLVTDAAMLTAPVPPLMSTPTPPGSLLLPIVPPLIVSEPVELVMSMPSPLWPLMLTLPIVIPIVNALGYDLIWFGVLMVIVLEMGLISPPVGMNLFVLKTLIPGVHQNTVFRGVLPFMLADVVRMAILIAFPIISLYLPSLMK